MTASTLFGLLNAPRQRVYALSSTPSTMAATGGRWNNTAMTPASTPGEALSSHSSSAFTLPDSSLQKFVIGVNARCQNGAVGSLRLWDRLVGVGSIDPTTTGDKTVNSTALTRYTSGAGVQVWLEVQVAPSTNIMVVSLASYTNQDGTNGKVGATSLTFPSATLAAGNLVGPMPLAAGDTGVRSVETLNVATASAGTTARLILWLVKPLYLLGFTDANFGVERQVPIPFAIPQILYDGFSPSGCVVGYSGTESVTVDLEIALV